MTESTPEHRTARTMPLRRWLALALVLLIVVPVLGTAITVRNVLSLPAFNRFSADDYLLDNVDRWQDPAWQEATRQRYSPDGIDFVLIEDGTEIYRSADDPLVGTSGQHAGRFVERHSVGGTNGEPVRSAIVYAIVNQTAADRFWIIPIVLFGTLLLTLGGIAWFLGRTVVRPLAATGAAAHQIADGNLEVSLPASRVREVSEVNRAFSGMSGALRRSLQQQSELEQQRRMFIGAVVHDLRTPLFSLRGSLEGIEQGVADTPEKRTRYIAVAREKAAALERLIADLFDFTRLEYLEQAPNREPLDLAALLERLTNGMQPQAEVKGVRISLDALNERCIVDGDAHLLTRAVENLLDNALRYTPSGGSIRVSCSEEPAGVRFSVADTGPGIPADDLPDLFTPMYRGETSRNRRTGGAGLGLTIARQILRAHDGELTASNAMTGGAVFLGTLPRVRGDE